MKKTIFLSLTILSILSYVFAGLLLGIYFTEGNPGMIMVFLVPLLVSGLLIAIIAFLLKKVKKVEFNQFYALLHYLNIILVLFGIIALIYTFIE